MRLQCTIRPDHIKEKKALACKSPYETHAYLARRKAPVSDLTAREFQLGS